MRVRAQVSTGPLSFDLRTVVSAAPDLLPPRTFRGTPPEARPIRSAGDAESLL